MLGYYEPRLRKLVLDLRHVENDSARECLGTLLHECHHAYQHAVAEVYVSLPENNRNLYLFDAARDYAKEFCDYNDGSKDVLGYLAQRTENDADAYARDAAKVYYERIGEGKE